MIATAIMQLWEKQKIDLDIDVNHYLPFSVRTPSFKNDSITARMLLTHTSAIQDEWNTLGSLYVLGDSPISLSSFMQKYFTHGATYYKAGNFYTYRPALNITTVILAQHWQLTLSKLLPVMILAIIVIPLYFKSCV